MSSPHFEYENINWKEGKSVVVGIDEVGRGACAGPVFAACVGFLNTIKTPREIQIDDSKKLSHKKRTTANQWIQKNALYCGIGMSEVSEVNELGIQHATFIAMARALQQSRLSYQPSIDHILVDGFYVPHFPREKQTRIIRGDSASFSIACASIVAKVARDAFMNELSSYFPLYQWNTNKGYGTKKHKEAILTYGSTKHHRVLFTNTLIQKKV